MIRWVILIGDRLAALPPFDRYFSIAAGTRAAGRKEPLRTAGFQQGFTRRILTSGGTGGLGGNTSLIVGAQGAIRFKDVDLITEADVETAIKEIILPEGGTTRFSYFPATGSLGGTKRTQLGNRSGGFGGLGGQAGNITVAGALFPPPIAYATVGGGGNREIYGINRPPNSVRPFASNDPLGDFVTGRRIEATGANGVRLYRLRLHRTTDGQLGGSGGVPASGITGEFPVGLAQRFHRKTSWLAKQRCNRDCASIVVVP